MKPKKRCRKGLTILELILATALFSVVGTILYSILSQGIRLWKHSQTERDRSGEERVMLQKMARDIRNAFIHGWVNFLGRSDEIYFCGLRKFPELPLSQEARLARIHYRFVSGEDRPEDRGLYLDETPIERTFSDKPPQGRRMTVFFKDLRFEFGYWDPVQEKIVLRDQWSDPKVLPRLVVLQGEGEKKFSQSVILPLGEWLEFEEEEEEP